MLGTLALALVTAALLMSVTATAVAWIFLATTRLSRRRRQLPSITLVFAILMGPISAWSRPAGLG